MSEIAIVILAAILIVVLFAGVIYLLFREQRKNDALHAKIDNQTMVQIQIEKEWLITIADLTNVLEERRTDAIQQSFSLSNLMTRIEKELKEFSEWAKKVDGYTQQFTTESGKWVLQITAFQEAINEIQSDLEKLQGEVSTKDKIIDSYFRNQEASGTRPKRNPTTKVGSS